MLSTAGPATLVALCALLSGCSGDGDASDPPGAAASPASSGVATDSATADPDPAYVVRRVHTGNAPCGILGVRGQVWVSNYSDDTLVRVDPTTGDVGDPIPTGDSPCGLAFGAGSIWVENYDSDDVTRVSARTGEVQGTYAVGSQPYDVTFADGAAWTTDFSGGTLSRIDAASGKVSRVHVGGQPIGAAPVHGQIWVGLNYEGVASVDARTHRVVHTLATDDVATWTAYDGDRLWIDVGDRVALVDPATGTVAGTVRVGPTPNDGTVVGDEVWVGDKDGDLFHFPASMTQGTAESIDSAVENPFVVTGLDGLVWAADFAGTDIVAIDPGRVP